MSAFQVECPVCHKTFTSYHEWPKRWCSVGCEARAVFGDGADCKLCGVWTYNEDEKCDRCTNVGAKE